MCKRYSVSGSPYSFLWLCLSSLVVLFLVATFHQQSLALESHASGSSICDENISRCITDGDPTSVSLLQRKARALQDSRTGSRIHPGRGPTSQNTAGHDESLLQVVRSIENGAASTDKRGNGDDNLCIEGRIAPELIFIGAQKAATTSLAIELLSIPGMTSGVCGMAERTAQTRAERNKEFRGDEPDVHKECHVYDDDMIWDLGMNWWLEAYPICSTDTRIVALDATPAYLSHSEKVPARIVERYGDQIHRLKFVVVLREPLSRMHSAFYHYKTWGHYMNLSSDAIDMFGKPFHEYIELMLNKNGEALPAGTHEDPFQNSLYSKQLRDFFKYFDADQFIIAPFINVVQEVSFPHYLSQRLGLPPSLINKTQENSGSHPTLETDLTPSLRNRAQKFIGNSLAGARSIARVLAEVDGKGADLFGFSGDPNNASDITQWLENNW